MGVDSKGDVAISPVRGGDVWSKKISFLFVMVPGTNWGLISKELSLWETLGTEDLGALSSLPYIIQKQYNTNP